MLTTADIIARRVPLCVGLGGGVNSTALLVELHLRNIRPDLIAFADTLGEKPETYAHLTELDAWLSRVGFPHITRLLKASPRTGDVSLEAECLRRETLPSRAFGMSGCAQRWKIEPQEKHLNNWAPARAAWAAGLRPIKALGFDGGETRRATIHEDAKVIYWYPLIEWDLDRAACVAAIESAGMRAPGKSSCFYCPSMRKSEVLELAREKPDLFARALAIEDRALISERHDLRTIKGLGRHWSWRELVTSADTSAYPEQPVESCTVCSDESE